jgi:hypothetical protein
MIIPMSRPNIALAATVDPVIEDLVNLMPDYSAGRRLHSLYVNRLQSALPGNYTQLFGTGPSFRGVFFPDWQSDPLLAVADETGLNQAWWSGFAVAVLCQAIAEMGSEIRGQMLTDKISTDVRSFNNTLRASSSRAYAKVLATAYTPLATLLQQVERNTAMARFHDSLLSNVISRQLWYQAGMWTSPDWEMFNQYAKYIALGASDAQVDTLIGELVAAGLPVPASVSQQGWRTYAEALRDKPTINVDDIRGACAKPISTSTFPPTFSASGGVAMPNGNCYEFTASSQPGSPYRRPPSGSCFTGHTEVLDGTGSAVPLRQIKRGDTVLTRDGTATVAYVATPLHADRPLYRLTGGGPVFTGTHPFLNADPGDAEPRLLAVEPGLLAWSVPTLSENGIGVLEAGSLVFSRGQVAPVPTTVAGVQQVNKDCGDYLYDLRLAGPRQEFWAGDGKRFHLVAPEYPVLDEAGPASVAVVAVMEGLLGTCTPAWPADIVDTVNEFGPGIFHAALAQALATTPSFGAPSPSGSAHDRIDYLYRELGDATTETSSVVASLFDGLLTSVGQWLGSVVALGWRTSLLPGGDVLAITVFDIALTPNSPIQADATIRLDVGVSGRHATDSGLMWNRRGRDNTRFHHYFDQILHLDMTKDPVDLSFTVTTDGAAVPALFAEAPGAVNAVGETLQSTQLRDASGSVVGTIRFDTRRLGHEAAAQELVHSGLWTDDKAHAYANALGGAMVEPILSKLRQTAVPT